MAISTNVQQGARDRILDILKTASVKARAFITDGSLTGAHRRRVTSFFYEVRRVKELILDQGNGVPSSVQGELDLLLRDCVGPLNRLGPMLREAVRLSYNWSPYRFSGRCRACGAKRHHSEPLCPSCGSE
jgi:hypothetical protein